MANYKKWEPTEVKMIEDYIQEPDNVDKAAYTLGKELSEVIENRSATSIAAKINRIKNKSKQKQRIKTEPVEYNNIDNDIKIMLDDDKLLVSELVVCIIDDVMNIVDRLEALLKEAKIVENWMCETLSMKEKIRYRIDKCGLVERDDNGRPQK